MTTNHPKTAGKGKTRKNLSPAKREQLDTERRAEVEGLLGRITDAVTQLHTEPGWFALLSAAARLHSYSLGNQILLGLRYGDGPGCAGSSTRQRHLHRRLGQGRRQESPCRRRSVTTTARTMLAALSPATEQANVEPGEEAA